MSGLDPLYAAKTIAAILLPLIGILVVLFCLLALMLPFGAKIKDKTQRFKGFGVDVELSVLALFVMTGLVLSLTGIYLVTRDYETKLQELAQYKTRLERAEVDFKNAIERSQRFDVRVLLDLEGVSDADAPTPDQLICQVQKSRDKLTTVEVEPGYKPNQYAANLPNVSSDTRFIQMVCKDNTRRGWIVENFAPLEPELMLRRRR